MKPEASLIVPDFNISAYGSSSNSIFVQYGLIFSYFRSLSIPWGCNETEEERIGARLRQKKTELHELPNTEIVKSRTIRLASLVIC